MKYFILYCFSLSNLSGFSPFSSLYQMLQSVVFYLTRPPFIPTRGFVNYCIFSLRFFFVLFFPFYWSFIKVWSPLKKMRLALISLVALVHLFSFGKIAKAWMPQAINLAFNRMSQNMSSAFRGLSRNIISTFRLSQNMNFAFREMSQAMSLAFCWMLWIIVHEDIQQ